MFALIKWLVLRLAAVRFILKFIGGWAVLLPLVLLLKTIGLPILGILAILFVPVLFVLFIFGLPIFLVLLVGGGIMAFLFVLLNIAIVVLKVAAIVALPVLGLILAWKIAKWTTRRVFDNGGNGTTGPSTDTTSGPTPADPIDGINPT